MKIVAIRTYEIDTSHEDFLGFIEWCKGLEGWDAEEFSAAVVANRTFEYCVEVMTHAIDGGDFSSPMGIGNKVSGWVWGNDAGVTVLSTF